MQPFVSVIVPVYNRQDTLQRTAVSVLNQTFRDLELIIVDDGSEDASVSVAQKIQRSDPRVRFLKNNRRKGAQGARNTGLVRSSAQWVLFLDSDNCLAPQMVEKLLEKASSQNADIVTCYSCLLQDRGTTSTPTGECFRWVTEGQISTAVLDGTTYVDTSSAIILREKLSDIQGLDEECPCFQEWDLHIRLSDCCEYAYVPDLLVEYHLHEGQMSKDKALHVRGLMFIYRKYRRRWHILGLEANWKHRMLETASLALKLNNGRWSAMAALAKLEPRLGYWLPLHCTTHKAMELARRVYSRLRNKR